MLFSIALLSSCGNSNIESWNTSKVQGLPDSSTTVETPAELPSGGLENNETNITELDAIVY